MPVAWLILSESLNFSVNVVDLNKISEDEIRSKAGSIAALCYALKSAKDMTKDRIKSVFELCHRDSKDTEGYREYANILSEYIFQTADYPKEVFYKIEQEVITKKEEIVMPSAYTRAVEEGIIKGMEKGMEKGRQEREQNIILNLLKSKVDISTIVKVTGVAKDKILQLQKQST